MPVDFKELLKKVLLIAAQQDTGTREEIDAAEAALSQDEVIELSSLVRELENEYLH